MGGGGVSPPRFLAYFNEFLEPEILCNLKQRWGFVRSLLPYRMMWNSTHSPSDTNFKPTIPSMKSMSVELPLIGSRAILTTQNCVCSRHCLGSSTYYWAHPKYKSGWALLSAFQFHSLVWYGFGDRYSLAVFFHHTYSRTGIRNISYCASRGLSKALLLPGWLHGDKRFLDSVQLLGAAIEGNIS